MLAALAALDADDDTTDEEVRARSEAQGVDFEAWGAAIKAQAAAAREARRERGARRASGCSEAREQGGPKAAPALSQVREEEEILRDGPASANDVEAVADLPGRRASVWSRLRHLARAAVVGLVAAGLVGLGSLALRWVTLLGAPFVKRMAARGATYAPALKGATAGSKRDPEEREESAPP